MKITTISAFYPTLKKIHLRNDLTDTARIAFMFNDGQSPGSILSSICTKNCKLFDRLDIVENLLLIHSNRLNHETYSEPCFPAPQLYLLSHTLKLKQSELLHTDVLEIISSFLELWILLRAAKCTVGFHLKFGTCQTLGVLVFLKFPSWEADMLNINFEVFYRWWLKELLFFTNLPGAVSELMPGTLFF